MTLQESAPTSLTACILMLLAPAMLWGMTAAAKPPDPTTAKTDDNVKPGAEPVASKTPTVIEVYPADQAEEVDPNSDIRIRFDQPMNPYNTDLLWDKGFFQPQGKWRYDATRHEFIIPAELKAHELQRVDLNSSLKTNPNRGFRSASGTIAQPFSWSFHTRRDFDDKEAPQPQVIEISPSSDTEIGQLVKVSIVFDQPMAPSHFHQVLAEEEGKSILSIPYFHLRYIEQENRFELPIELPIGWSGLLKFSGFRSQSNRHASTIQARYTTGGEPLTQAHHEQLGQAAQSRDLWILLQDMANSRKNLKTISEKSRTTQYAPGKEGIFTSMRSASAQFHLDGSQKFYADVSEMMEYPFVIGSDGTTCWWYSQDDEGKQLAQIPLGQLDHINLVISDPFGLSRVPAGQSIARMNLEYLGVEKFGSKDCFVIQSWNVDKSSPEAHPNITRWWIDPDSYLVLQSICEWGTALRVVHHFTYQQIDQPIPAAQFAMPRGKDIRKRPLEGLGDGYNYRYVNIGDPSPGVMSVEWGRYGSAGQKGIGVR